METGENVKVDNSEQRSGNASLRLVCTEQNTSVMSLPFKAPKTGTFGWLLMDQIGQASREAAPSDRRSQRSGLLVYVAGCG